jgi:hypothetical protein
MSSVTWRLAARAPWLAPAMQPPTEVTSMNRLSMGADVDVARKLSADGR